MHINLAQTPFSRRGSWLAIAAPLRPDQRPWGEGLYLITNHGRGVARRQLFRLQALQDGRPVEVSTSATPGRLELSAPGGRIRLALDGDSVHLEGEGLDLDLEAGSPDGFDRTRACHFNAHPDGPGRVSVNHRPALLRIGVDCRQGSVLLDAPWQGELCERVRVGLRGGADGCWRAALDEYQSTWVPPPGRPTVSEVAASAATDFERFATAFPLPAARWQDTARLAIWNLWSCTVAPRGYGRRRWVGRWLRTGVVHAGRTGPR